MNLIEQLQQVPDYRHIRGRRHELWLVLLLTLKNQIFSSLQTLRDRIQEIFDQLRVDQVISISSYNFILEALFYAASY